MTILVFNHALHPPPTHEVRARLLCPLPVGHTFSCQGVHSTQRNLGLLHIPVAQLLRPDPGRAERSSSDPSTSTTATGHMPESPGQVRPWAGGFCSAVTPSFSLPP